MFTHWVFDPPSPLEVQTPRPHKNDNRTRKQHRNVTTLLTLSQGRRQQWTGTQSLAGNGMSNPWHMHTLSVRGWRKQQSQNWRVGKKEHKKRQMPLTTGTGKHGPQDDKSRSSVSTIWQLGFLSSKGYVRFLSCGTTDGWKRHSVCYQHSMRRTKHWAVTSLAFVDRESSFRLPSRQFKD